MKNHIRGYALRDTDVFKIVYFNTNDEICKETGKYDLYTEQKKNTGENAAFERAQWSNFADKTSKTYYKIFKELKETMHKEVKADIMAMSHQIENVKKRDAYCTRELNRNSGDEK